jgi:hypothetical protein
MFLQKSRRSSWAFIFVAILVAAHLSAQSPAPQAYSLTEVTGETEASMSTGQPSTVKIFRSDSKELVELTIAPWSANPKGVHMSYLFDFAAHRAYTRDLDHNACSWMKYVSADAPTDYDPITGSAQAMPKLAKAIGGTLKVLGTESLHGIPAKIESISSPGAPDLFKGWVAEKGDFMLKFVGPAPGTGTPETTFEVKQLSFARPLASLFAAPTGCSETQGEWSDAGLSASASKTVAVGTPSPQPGGEASASSASPQAVTPAPANLVANGDFESGNTGFTAGYAYGNVSGPATYWIGANASQAPGAYGDWYNGGDHTTGTGNMLVVNGANSATTPVWEEVVHVTPNTKYIFSYWGAEVDHDSNSLPHLQLRINGRSLGSNVIPANSPDNGGRWVNFTFIWNSGSSSRADLALFDLNTDTAWNDFALDDISFAAHPAP